MRGTRAREAASASARLGARTALVTINLDLIGQMSCNPAVGGIAKGRVVREIDAPGGIMGRVIDRTGIQFRLLNGSRGPAVQSPQAATFEVDKAIRVGGLPLSAGKYTLWTIPQASSWTVIFNSKMYSWGVTYGGEAQRDATADVATVEVPVQSLPAVVEQFTIDVSGTPPALNLQWDQTKVSVPITR